jgi:hypothetical protein
MRARCVKYPVMLWSIYSDQCPMCLHISAYERACLCMYTIFHAHMLCLCHISIHAHGTPVDVFESASESCVCCMLVLSLALPAIKTFDNLSCMLSTRA